MRKTICVASYHTVSHDTPSPALPHQKGEGAIIDSMKLERLCGGASMEPEPLDRTFGADQWPNPPAFNGIEFFDM
jgi:hypothetical protein